MHNRAVGVAGAIGALAGGASGQVETTEFFFARVNQSYSAAIFADNPIVGMRIVAARIYLDVRALPGSDGADFFTDILLPIEPDPGNVNTFSFAGADNGWSGSGDFSFFEETTRFNGIFVARRYGAESPCPGFEGEILDGSRIEVDYVVPTPGAAGLLGLAGAGVCLRRRR